MGQTNALKPSVLPSIDRLTHHRTSAKATPPVDVPILSSPHLLQAGPLTNMQITASNPTSASISTNHSTNATQNTDNSSTDPHEKKSNAASSVLAQTAGFANLQLNNENADRKSVV